MLYLLGLKNKISIEGKMIGVQLQNIKSNKLGTGMKINNQDIDDSNSIADLKNFPIVDLLDLLKQNHRYYLDKKLLEIDQSLYNLQKNHPFSNSNNILIVLSLFYIGYKTKLESHIKDEEDNLFPYIEKLVKISDNIFDKREVIQILDSYSISKFNNSHIDIENDLKDVRTKIIKHSKGEDLPFQFKIFLAQIEHFELDLNRHNYIEDEILFPKAMELELTIKRRFQCNI